MKEIIKKIRVFDDAGQDNAGAWICQEFPEITWIRNRSQVFSYMCGGKEREAQVKGPYTWEPYEKNNPLIYGIGDNIIFTLCFLKQAKQKTKRPFFIFLKLKTPFFLKKNGVFIC